MFDRDDADVILRATHGTESRDFRVHKLLLSLTSPIFQDMFKLPQPSLEASAIQTIDVADPPRALDIILRFIYPSENTPVIDDFALLSEVLIVADKYDIAVARSRLRRSLEELAKTEPLKVYAIASRFGFENEMKIASSYTTSIHLPGLVELPEEFKFVSAVEYHRLIRLHERYRKEVAVLASNSGSSAGLPPPVDFRRSVSAAIEGPPLNSQSLTKALIPAKDYFGEFADNKQFINAIFDRADQLNLTV